jgi:hypothetical protein
MHACDVCKIQQGRWLRTKGQMQRGKKGLPRSWLWSCLLLIAAAATAVVADSRDTLLCPTTAHAAPQAAAVHAHSGNTCHLPSHEWQLMSSLPHVSHVRCMTLQNACALAVLPHLWQLECAQQLLHAVSQRACELYAYVVGTVQLERLNHSLQNTTARPSDKTQHDRQHKFENIPACNGPCAVQCLLHSMRARVEQQSKQSCRHTWRQKPLPNTAACSHATPTQT